MEQSYYSCLDLYVNKAQYDLLNKYLLYKALS